MIGNLEYFTNIGLKQHLDYALHNVITSSNDNSSNILIKGLQSNIKTRTFSKKRTRKESERLSKLKIKSNSSDSD